MAELRCSFCNRSQKETRKLVTAPSGNICNECISLCAELIAQEDRGETAGSPPSKAKPTSENRDPVTRERAIAELLLLVESDPEDVRARLKLGDLYVSTGRSDDAAKHYEYVAAHYANDGMLMKAIAVYKQLLKVFATQKGVHSRLGELYERLGLMPDAIAHYEADAKAYELAGDPGTASALRHRTKVLASTPATAKDQIPSDSIPPGLSCSFCRKPKDAVKKLIAGPTVYICNECVAVAVEVAKE